MTTPHSPPASQQLPPGFDALGGLVGHKPPVVQGQPAAVLNEAPSIVTASEYLPAGTE